MISCEFDGIMLQRQHIGFGGIAMNELNDKWISIDAAAEYLDVNKDSIRNWI